MRPSIPVPRTALATYVLCTFIIMSAFAIAILQINRRADQGVRSTHAVGVCILREVAKFNLRVRLSSEQNAQANQFRLAVPPDLEPRLPVQTKHDPCEGLLTNEHIDVPALLAELGASTPTPTGPTTTTASRPNSQLTRLRRATAASKTTRGTTSKPSTTSASVTTTTTSPAPPTTDCTLPTAQLCGLLP